MDTRTNNDASNDASKDTIPPGPVAHDTVRIENASHTPTRPPSDAGAGIPTPAAGIAPPDPTDRLPAGTFLGADQRYRIEHQLGRGGFCATYCAYDTQLNRLCVIKHLIIDPGWDAETIQLAQYGFQREVQLLSSLGLPGHYNIPDIYEFLAESNCLVMKYIEGMNLRQRIQQPHAPLPLADALSYIRAVCSALAYMHDHNPTPVLHRDIKPENILLGRDGRIWLIDFGLAKSVPRAGADQSNNTRSAGTPGYTPSEQWRGAAEPRSDIYALAATLYTLATGTTPLPDSAGEIPPARQHNPALPIEVELLIAEGMAEDVARRPLAQTLLESLDLLCMSLANHARLQAPDGTLLNDRLALVAWCEQHWAVAANWLYTSLPKHVRLAWSDTQFESDLRQSAEDYPTDRDAGLDAALALIDPQGFGAQAPMLGVGTETLNFGALERQANSQRDVIVANTGRRYVRTHVARPFWMHTPTPTIALPPGQRHTLNLQAEQRKTAFRRRLRDTIRLRQDATTLAQIQVRAVCRSWLRVLLSWPWIWLALVLLGLAIVKLTQ